MTDIQYTIQRNKRRTRLTISVTCEGVIVKAPVDSPEKQIHSFVNKHKEWIKIKQAEMHKVVSQKKVLVFADGEKIPFLDNIYTLRINENSSYKLQRRNDELHIDIPANLSDDQKRKYIVHILKKWYKIAAMPILKEKIKYFSTQIGVENPNKISIRDANTRFGSCNSKNNIMINLRLFLAPEKVLDYVIIHELCHIVHLNHSKDFWNMVQKHCKSYKQHKNWLKQHSLELMLK